MTNEMKLITALCDALGFEVEKNCVNTEDAYYNLTALAAFSRELIYEYKLTKSVDSKANYSGIPKSFIDDNLKKIKGSTMFGIPLEELTKEELMCCVVFSWDESKKARDAANNQNNLDIARFYQEKT
jgi:hypothetical protein